MSEFSLKLTAEERQKLEAAGVRVFYGEIPERTHTLRELARICDMAEAWVRTQLKTKKIVGRKVKSGNREIWGVDAAEVARIRQEQVDKHLGRLDRKETGKKYSYRRPTEWAYHLMTKAINDDKELTPSQKKMMRQALKRYQSGWEAAYKERVAKREAKKAEEEAKKQKKA